jgi:hypothetical protein
VQLETDESLPAIVGFEIEDNGVGFTECQRRLDPRLIPAV